MRYIALRTGAMRSITDALRRLGRRGAWLLIAALRPNGCTTRTVLHVTALQRRRSMRMSERERRLIGSAQADVIVHVRFSIDPYLRVYSVGLCCSIAGRSNVRHK